MASSNTGFCVIYVKASQGSLNSKYLKEVEKVVTPFLKSGVCTLYIEAAGTLAQKAQEHVHTT